MSPDPLITNPEAMLLLALASKAALVAEDLENSPDNPTFPTHMERAQFVATASEVRAILARLDKEWPGLIPVPHDGVTWKNRVENDDFKGAL